MTPREFIKTIYYGDRACKALLIDTWQSKVKLQIDSISRIRSATGTWDYYADEDISDCYLVFADVESIELINSGHLPNDLINRIVVISEVGEKSTIEVSITSIDHAGVGSETLIRVQCLRVYLEDPAHPNVPITD